MHSETKQLRIYAGDNVRIKLNSKEVDTAPLRLKSKTPITLNIYKDYSLFVFFLLLLCGAGCHVTIL